MLKITSIKPSISSSMRISAVVSVQQVRFHQNDGTKGGGSGGPFNGRGRKRRSHKLTDKYFDTSNWGIEEGFSPFSTLPPSTHIFSGKDSSTTQKGQDGKLKNGGQNNADKKKTGQDPKSAFDAADPSKFGLKSIDVFQQFIQANSGRQAPRKNVNPFANATLKDAVTLQEYTETLDDMLQKINPRSLKTHLDEFIIGQDKAKQALSCAVFNHYSRVFQNLKGRKEALTEFPSKPPKTLIDKSNILILGPSGSGKTLMAKRIAEILEVPFCMNDATTFTQAGYVGDDVEQCIARLLQSAEHDVKKTEIGIVFIDEIDKISKRETTTNNTSRDVAGEGVQQALLKMLEGTTVYVQEKGKKKNDETTAIDTSNILFILSGAFVGIEKQIQHRNAGSRSIGFGAKVSPPPETLVAKSSLDEVNEVDLINYGLIPEFVGRIPILVSVNKLTEDELVRILSEPKNSLVEQYKRLFTTWGIRLDFSNEALHAVAKKVMNRQTGARGLKFVMEDLLKQAMYFGPGTEVKRITINGDLISVFQTETSSFTIANDPSSAVPERIEVDIGDISLVAAEPAVSKEEYPIFTVPPILKPLLPPVGKR